MAYLQSQINTLLAPQLVKINLEETDVRPPSGTPYLHIRSLVVNIGTNTANNCTLHIILYQGSTTAKETDITLMPIVSGTGVSVDQQIYYSGSALTDWSVMPVWTS